MIYRLIVLNGPARGQRITVPGSPVTLGRGEDCTLVLDDEEVAAHHAVVEHTSGGMYIRDLGTMSHILVNNREVSESRLKHGDVVELGRTQFLVQVSVQAEVNGVGVALPRSRRTSTVFVMLLFVACAGAAGMLGYHYWPARGGEYLGPELTAIDLDDIPRPSPAEENAEKSETGVSPAPEPADGASPDSGSASSEASSGSPAASGTALRETGRTPEPETVPEPGPAREPARPSSASEPELPDRPAAPPPQAVAKPPPAPTGLIGVDNVQQSRFPQADDFAEMRLVKVKLVPKVAVDTIDVSDVRVQVVFYDRDARSGAVKPTKAIVTTGPLEPDGAWLPEQERTLDATYVVPKSRLGGGRRNARYYGHVVRVFYGDTLQDVYARPLDLGDSRLLPRGQPIGRDDDATDR
jgi:pSer/pThr/pTyr-binding forkhead associated (FHA) protein